uniref:Ig-like domain-containing protein n=1 Tax=Electrophorus electricus TaxID=8005 RepID=A0A4W4E3H3_ELEEL
MSLRTPLLTLTLITLVKYKQTEICALKGSTVFINDSYTYPAGLEVKEEFWVKEPFDREQDTPVYCRPTKDSGRVQCYVDKQQHFSLKLINVTKEDEHDYRFRIKTNVAKQKWLGDLVKITVTEREAAVLTCTTSCSLTDSPTFIWYKNGRCLSSSTNPLHLRPVSSEDAGSYMCAVRGYEHLPSPAQTLTVRYPPQNVSVSISPSGEIVEGSSVTLTCSSDANPPVQNYNWFKEKTLLGKESTHIIPNISSEDSGEYKCKSINEHGSKYSSLILNVMYPPKNVSVSISLSGEIVEGSSVTLICNSDANPSVQNFNWFKEGRTSPVGSGQNYRVLQSGFYYCAAQNHHGAQNSSTVSVLIKATVMPTSRPASASCFLPASSLQNADPDSTDDAYTALELKVRPSDNLYDVLAVSIFKNKISLGGCGSCSSPGSTGSVRC